MDSVAEAAAGPVKRQLTESAEQGVAESTESEQKELAKKIRELLAAGKDREANHLRHKLNNLRDRERGKHDRQQGVAEARPDVMRHKGDKTIKIVKRAGKPIGEIGTDSEASPGNGAYYVKLYDGSYDAVGFDTAAEALAELKAAIKQGVAEGVAESVDPVAQLRADILRFSR
jgi:hypothetical protein